MPQELREVDARDRRIIIVASPEKRDELRSSINWGDLAHIGFLPLPASGMAMAIARASGWSLLPSVLDLAVRLVDYWLKRRKSVLPYPTLDLSAAREQFDFPISHPTDGLVYACSEAEPLLYVPLERFHRYTYEAKLAAFHELCAALGAKRTSVVYAEEEGKDVTAKFKVQGVPTSAGPLSVEVGGGWASRHSEDFSLVNEYPRPVTNPSEHKTLWMVGEPTWSSMQKLRLERGLERCRAEFNYSDDMGINAEVAAKLCKVGFKLGGKYEHMKKLKLEYNVEFWPIQ